ncbi:MAG: type II secretion system F family protein [archaeon]
MPEDEIEELLKKEKEEAAESEEVDREALDKIVDRMADKYKKEGILKEDEIPEKTKELRKIMRGERQYGVGEKSAKELKKFENPLIKIFGKVYTVFENPMGKITNILERTMGRGLERNLVAARMKYSSEQYLTLSFIASIFISLVALAAGLGLNFIGIGSMLISILIAILIIPTVLGFALLIPKSRAEKIGNEIEKQMPFALRHMSIEIRAGVGIYETMNSIAKSNYGKLSEGFEWVLGQIEKGVTTEDALEAWSERTRSQDVRRVVGHLTRALRTGGSLSDIMSEIAEDVSFERRQKIEDFAEKLNLLGLFLMMVAIVFPVMIAILTSIGSVPTLQQYLGMFAIFTPTFLMLVFFVMVPSFLLLFIFYVKSSDPGSF